MEQHVAEFAVSVLKKYADKNQVIVRSTSDLSPLEDWLLVELHKTQEAFDDLQSVFQRRINELGGNYE